MDPERTKWPSGRDTLEALQIELAELRPTPWSPSADPVVGGCFVCFARGGSGAGADGDHGWSAATIMVGGGISAGVSVEGVAGGAYVSGLLALREGPLLEEAVAALGSHRPEVLMVNATGRDHPRRAGLALQLGWALDLPTIGVTHRPLLALGDQPANETAARTPLWIDREQVGCWLRTKAGARPLAVSPGWRTDLDVGLEVVMGAVGRFRTPEPLREARRLARTARAAGDRRCL